MGEDLLLTIRTSQHSYIVRRDQIGELRLIVRDEDLQRSDERGRKVVSGELESFLNAQDIRSLGCRHALIVYMRRRSVALLVERIEDVVVDRSIAEVIHPLPPLLRQHLARPWFLGVLIREETPLLVLDLRQIAQDLLFSTMQKSS